MIPTREIRYLLANLHRPERLRENAVAAPFFRELASLPPTEQRAVALARLQRELDSCLAKLPQRRRRIIELYDLQGEPIDAVARRLNVSRRHAYRERAHAIAELAKAFHVTRGAPAATYPIDAVAASLCHADALELAGRWSEAAAVLERLATDASRPEDRSIAALRLSVLRGDMGRPANCQPRSQAAGEQQATSPSARLAHAEMALAEAISLEFLRRPDEVARCAEGALAMLQGLEACGPLQDRVADARVVGKTLLLSSFGPRTLESILRAASEVVDLAERSPGVRPGTLIEAYLARGWVRSFQPGLLDDALGDYLRVAQIANVSGMPQQLVRVSDRAAALYTLRGQPQRAISVLQPLLDLARNICAPQTKCGVLNDLGCALIAAGRSREAVVLLHEVRTTLPNDEFLTSLSLRYEARALVQLRQPAAALAAARRAVIGFSRFNSTHDVAGAMHAEAMALASLGDTTGAASRLTDALEIGASTSNPLILAKMRYDHGILHRDRRAAAIARREFQMLAR